MIEEIVLALETTPLDIAMPAWTAKTDTVSFENLFTSIVEEHVRTVFASQPSVSLVQPPHPLFLKESFHKKGTTMWRTAPVDDYSLEYAIYPDGSTHLRMIDHQTPVPTTIGEIDCLLELPDRFVYGKVKTTFSRSLEAYQKASRFLNQYIPYTEVLTTILGATKPIESWFLVNQEFFQRIDPPRQTTALIKGWEVTLNEPGTERSFYRDGNRVINLNVSWKDYLRCYEQALNLPVHVNISSDSGNRAHREHFNKTRIE